MELKTKRAVFAGTARNCSRFLPKVFQNVSRLAALYEDAAFVIAENDSDDETKSMLRSWLCRQSRGHLIELDALAAAEPRRTQRIATARNAYLDLILSGPYYGYDHLIILDFDDVNALPISIEDFLASVNFLEAKPAAAGVFANQATAYYDIYSLRHHLVPGRLLERGCSSAALDAAGGCANPVCARTSVFDPGGSTADSCTIGIWRIGHLQNVEGA